MIYSKFILKLQSIVEQIKANEANSNCSDCLQEKYPYRVQLKTHTGSVYYYTSYKHEVGDTLLLQMCLTSLAVVLGFFVFNWPKGAIFLGDAGAYLIGFWVVELGILLAMRNPQISPMAPVVVGLLPLIETLFSMYRRNVIRNRPVNQPDALHLHTLVYRRILFNPALTYTANQLNAVNAKVAIFFWLPAAIFAFLACIFAESTEAQLGLMLIYLIMYNWLYFRLVRFNVPALMRFR